MSLFGRSWIKSFKRLYEGSCFVFTTAVNWVFTLDLHTNTTSPSWNALLSEEIVRWRHNLGISNTVSASSSDNWAPRAACAQGVVMSAELQAKTFTSVPSSTAAMVYCGADYNTRQSWPDIDAFGDETILSSVISISYLNNASEYSACVAMSSRVDLLIVVWLDKNIFSLIYN